MSRLEADDVKRANPLDAFALEVLGEGKRRSAKELAFRCPFHEDRDPSLHVDPVKDGGVFICRSCGARGDIFTLAEKVWSVPFAEALSRLAARGGISSNNNNGGKGHRTVQFTRKDQPSHYSAADIEREHLYIRNGVVIARHILLKRRDPNGKKIMPWERPDGKGGWLSTLADDDPGLYRFDEACALPPARDGRLIIAEGERDVDRLLALDLPATCSPYGAAAVMGDKWRPDYTAQIHDRGFAVIRVLGDHDAAGEGYNNGVTRALRAAGLSDVSPVPWPSDSSKGFDVADFLDAHGADGKRRLCERLRQPPDWTDAAPALMATPLEADAEQKDSRERRPVLVRLADVQPEAVTWLWPGRLASGKLAVLAGDPGLGKSWITLDIAARITSGRPMPDGAPAVPIGDVVLLSAEDGVADTIRPRLDGLGADVDRIHYLAVLKQGEAERAVQLADTDMLERAIRETNARLMIIDPMSAYLRSTDSHRDAEVRGLLAPLAAVAERTAAAVLGVMHLAKSTQRPAIYRAIGSIAFVGAARLALAVAKDPEREERRLVMPLKSNLSAPASTLAYTLADGRLHWEADPVTDVDVDALLAGPTPDRQERREAESWLRDALTAGPVQTRELQASAREAGLSWRTVERARQRLGIQVERIGYGPSGRWYWRLDSSSNTANTATEPPKTAKDETVAVYEPDRGKSLDFTDSSSKTATPQCLAVYEPLEQDVAVSDPTTTTTSPSTGGDPHAQHRF